MKAALFKLCQVVWRTERQPDRWSKSTLVQCYKGKGPRTVLDNMRHLHMKDEIPKFFSHLVMSEAKGKMTACMTKYQIGTKPGHRAQEHLFVLKSMISLHIHYGKSIILSMWDVSKFFDREALKDCMNELYKSNVQGKLYRLLFEMNKNTKISVQTPVGLTEECDTGEGVGQGTLEGAIISAVNLDSGVNDFFHDSEHEVNYGGVEIKPLLFQDDVARLATDLESVQFGNDKMEALAETKLLNFNLEKSCFIVMGNKKTRREMQEKVQDHPIHLCGINMKQEEQAKYLGDWLSALGLADSVAYTVKKRKGLAIHSIHEIRAVVDDSRSLVCGGLEAGLDIWEMAVLPMLLYNSECWQDISPQTIQELEDIQRQFYRCLFAVGTGCPIPSLYWETGGLMMRFRILQSKLLFLHHLETLPDDSLAKEVYDVQQRLSFPGLVQECNDFMVKFGITRINQYSKIQWKTLVKNKISKMNKEAVISQSSSYKKISFEHLTDDKFERQPYISKLNISEARLRFKLKAKMTPTIQMNFPSDSEFAANMWTCTGCTDNSRGDMVVGSRDTQQHVMLCPGYADIREDTNFDDDRQLVWYFQQVIKRRLDSDNNI